MTTFYIRTQPCVPRPIDFSRITNRDGAMEAIQAQSEAVSRCIHDTSILIESPLVEGAEAEIDPVTIRFNIAHDRIMIRGQRYALNHPAVQEAFRSIHLTNDRFLATPLFQLTDYFERYYGVMSSSLSLDQPSLSLITLFNRESLWSPYERQCTTRFNINAFEEENESLLNSARRMGWPLPRYEVLNVVRPGALQLIQYQLQRAEAALARGDMIIARDEIEIAQQAARSVDLPFGRGLEEQAIIRRVFLPNVENRVNLLYEMARAGTIKNPADAAAELQTIRSIFTDWNLGTSSEFSTQYKVIFIRDSILRAYQDTLQDALAAGHQLDLQGMRSLISQARDTARLLEIPFLSDPQQAQALTYVYCHAFSACQEISDLETIISRIFDRLDQGGFDFDLDPLYQDFCNTIDHYLLIYSDDLIKRAPQGLRPLPAQLYLRSLTEPLLDAALARARNESLTRDERLRCLEMAFYFSMEFSYTKSETNRQRALEVAAFLHPPTSTTPPP